MSMTAAHFALRLAEPDAMTERDAETLPVGPPRRRDTDQNAFTDPRFVLQIIALVFSVAGGMLITYVTTATRTTTLEVAAANMDKTATEMKTQMASIAAIANAALSESSTRGVELAARGREIEDMKRKQELHEARIISLERQIARVEGRRD